MKNPTILSVNGTLKLIKGDYQGGINELNQAILAFRQEINISQLALALTRRSTGQRYLGDYVASIKDADEAIQLIENNDEFQALYAEALHIKGTSMYRSGRARQALKVIEKSLETFTRLNQVANIPSLSIEIGMIYQTLGKYTEAEKTYNKALDIWKHDANIWMQAVLLNNIGNMYHQEGEYEKAAFAYEDGLICSRRSHHTRTEALISIGLGDLYTELQDFEMAHQNYQYAEAMLQEREDLFLLFSLQLGLANLALLQNDFHYVS
jgi:tetratricopeptide (TPR) repeat protein